MIKEQRIRERAHSIWESEGRPSDRAEAHWSMAVAELAAEGGRRPKPLRKTAAASAPTPSVRARNAPARKARTVASPA